jgi:hypothetical protein
MPDVFNPYAPPAAEVEHRGQVGEVVRKGKLVGMHPEGQLPARCVACNAAAPDRRQTRVLYWTPLVWRVSLWVVLAALFGLMSAGVLIAAIAFWPAVLVASIGHYFVRKKVSLDLAVCGRHRRIQAVLAWVQALGFVLLVAGFFYLVRFQQAALLVAALPVLAVGLARNATGAFAVRVARLERNRVWLKGAGKSFRDSLPETADA